MADDGGSSGRLRELLNVVALGDIRKCLVALAEEDSALAIAFERRFEEGELAGHVLGELILAGLVDATGDLVLGVSEAAHAARGARATWCRPPASAWCSRPRRPRHGGRTGGGQGTPDIRTVSLVPADASHRRWPSSGSPRRTRS